MPAPNEVLEAARDQLIGEEIVYSVECKDVTASPAAPSVTVIDKSDDSDVTTVVMPTNTPTFTGTIMTLSIMKTLSANRVYRVLLTFTDGGSNKFVYFFDVRALPQT